MRPRLVTSCIVANSIRAVCWRDQLVASVHDQFHVLGAGPAPPNAMSNMQHRVHEL